MTEISTCTTDQGRQISFQMQTHAKRKKSTHLQSDQEQEQHKSDRRHQVQVAQTLLREDGSREARNTTERSRTEDDASEDFGDDFWLAEFGEGDGEGLGEGHDDGELDDEEGYWLGIDGKREEKSVRNVKQG